MRVGHTFRLGMVHPRKTWLLQATILSHIHMWFIVADEPSVIAKIARDWTLHTKDFWCNNRGWGWGSDPVLLASSPHKTKRKNLGNNMEVLDNATKSEHWRIQWGWGGSSPTALLTCIKMFSISRIPTYLPQLNASKLVLLVKSNKKSLQNTCLFVLWFSLLTTNGSTNCSSTPALH